MQKNNARNTKKQLSAEAQNKKSSSRQANVIRERQTTLSIPKAVGCYMPDRLKTTLRFWKSVAVNLTPTSTAAIRFAPSAAYDIDPTVASAAMVGFAQLAAMYGSYRVHSSYAKVECVNEGDVTTKVTLVPTNLDPGASPSSNYVISATEQPYAVSRTLSAVGGPITVLENKMSTQKIYGSPMTKYDDNFASLSNTTPNNNWYWVVAFYAMAIATKAVICNFYCEVDVDFYDRVNVLK